MNNLKTAEFHGNNLTIINHDGQQWFTAEDVGNAIGYNVSNARVGVNNLYNRNFDEFSKNDTCVIKLMTQGQNREVRIFSRTGCNLLGFFANTPRAKEFRKWAKQALISGQNAQINQLTELKDELENEKFHNELKEKQINRICAVFYKRYPQWQTAWNAWANGGRLKSLRQLETENNLSRGAIRRSINAHLRYHLTTPSMVGTIEQLRIVRQLEVKYGEVQNG